MRAAWSAARATAALLLVLASGCGRRDHRSERDVSSCDPAMDECDVLPSETGAYTDHSETSAADTATTGGSGGLSSSDLDGDGFSVEQGDCDDTDNARHPDQQEVLDWVDQDCDGVLDEETEGFDDDGDGVTEIGGDCDDGNLAISPRVVETLDGLDDDCDGVVDNDTPAADDDGDGYCEALVCLGLSAPGDCNDKDSMVSPSALELGGNLLDDDCNGDVDFGSPDLDADGFASPVDCNDTSALASPIAGEVVNGLDDDCDSVVDNHTVIFDDDGDGYCEDPAYCLLAASPGDCDDRNGSVHPVDAEFADGVDQNCNGSVDEGTTWSDDDGDGFAEVGGDCDDRDPTRSPMAGCP